MNPRALLLLPALCACGRVGFEDRLGEGADAAPDSSQRCVPGAAFGTPVKLDSLDAPSVLDGTLRLLPDELSGYFWSNRNGTDSDIYLASRGSLDEPFVVQAITGINTASQEVDPTISADGSLLVFRRSVPGDNLYTARRTSPTSFDQVAAITTLNTNASEQQPYLVATETELIYAAFASGSIGLGDLFRSARTGNVFAAPVRLASLATVRDEGDPALSPDGLTLYFRSDRPTAGFGAHNIYVATRPDLASDFGAAVLVDGVNSDVEDGPSFISGDDCRLYLSSERDGQIDIFVATRGG